MLATKPFYLSKMIAIAALSLIISFALFVCAFASVLLPPIWPALLVGLGYVAICFLYPVAGFCSVLFAQTFDKLLVLVPHTSSGEASILNALTIPKFMFTAFFFALIMHQFGKNEETLLKGIRGNSLFVMLGLLFIISCLPASAAASLEGGTIMMLMRLTNCMILCISVFAIIQTYKSLCGVFYALLPAFVISGLIGVFEILTQTHFLTLLGRPISSDYTNPAEAGYFRVLGPNGDPVSYATCLLIGVVCALVVLHRSRRRIIKTFCLLSLVLFGFCTLSTGSRGGMLGCAALFGVFFLLGKIRHKWTIAISAVLAGFIGLTLYTFVVSPIPAKRFTSVDENDEGTLNRIGFYTQCIRMAQDSPLIGVGLGRFSSLQINTYFDNRTPRRPYHPHNVYLQIPAESGFFALAIYLAILATSSVPLLHVVLLCKDTERRNIGAAVLGGVVGLAVFATNTNLREQEYAWLMFSLALVGTRVLGPETVMPRVPSLGRRRQDGRDAPEPDQVAPVGTGPLSTRDASRV